MKLYFNNLKYWLLKTFILIYYGYKIEDAVVFKDSFKCPNNTFVIEIFFCTLFTNSRYVPKNIFQIGVLLVSEDCTEVAGITSIKKKNL